MLYDYEHQILIGTILGGSSLVKPQRGTNYHLSMRSKNHNWLRYKMAEMPTYFLDCMATRHGNTTRCHSKSSPHLTVLHGRLYDRQERRVTMGILDSLHDIALAVWFLDGGGKSGRQRKNAYFNISQYDEGSITTIVQYFNEIGISCRLTGRKIFCTVEGTKVLVKTIAHRVPTFMLSRLC